MHKYITARDLATNLKKVKKSILEYSNRIFLLEMSLDEIHEISGGQVLEKEDQLNYEFLKKENVRYRVKLSGLIAQRRQLEFIEEYRKYNNNNA